MSFLPFQAHDEEPTGLIGNLRDVRLAEIVQLFALSGKTAVIDVVLRGGEAGSLVVEGGQVLYAELGAQSGDDAVFELLAQCSGTFRVYVGSTSGWNEVTCAPEPEPGSQEPDVASPTVWPERPFVAFFDEAGVLPAETVDDADVGPDLVDGPTSSDVTVVERRHS